MRLHAASFVHDLSKSAITNAGFDAEIESSEIEEEDSGARERYVRLVSTFPPGHPDQAPSNAV